MIERDNSPAACKSLAEEVKRAIQLDAGNQGQPESGQAGYNTAGASTKDAVPSGSPGK